MANPIIDLQDIDVTFKQGKEVVHAVKDVSLSIEKGDIYGIVGYSGAGKSTLVRTINLLQKPTDGTVTIDGDLDDDAQEKKAYELLELVGLKDKAEFYPVQLSGGEQQRVSIARALANDPAILISDEATSALDPQNTNQILDLLKKLNTELDLTVVLITHEMDAVKRVANKIAVMEHGQIIERGPLQKVFLQPQRELTRQFVGGSLAAIDTLKAFDLDQLTADEDLFQLVYNGNNVTKSIIIELYKKLGVEASMLYGNIEVLGGEPVGTLFVVVKGDEQQRQAAVQFLQDNKVTVTKIDDRRIWHE